MRKIGMLAVFLFYIMPVALAGSGNRSTIRIRLSDGSPLMVTINGRDFGKIGRSLTIGDIPGRRQYIQVYKYRRYADGKGGKAELTYSGNIKVQKGSTYDCIVDVGSHKFRMKEVASLTALPAPMPLNRNSMQTLDQAQNTESTLADDDDIALNMPAAPVELTPKLQVLKKSMSETDEDSKKLTQATLFVRNNTVSTADIINIAGWMFFDDNKMKFVKLAYNRVSDKNNYDKVGGVFTLEQSRKEFEDFMKSK